MKKNCRKKNVRKESLEDVVSKALLKNFQNAETIDIIADKIIQINKQRIADQSLFNILNEEKCRLENSKKNIMIAIEQGIITNTTKERLQELEMALDENATKLLMEKTKSKMNLSKEEILLHIKKALKNNANRLIDILVKEIKLYDDKIEITCNYTNDKSESNQPLEMIVAEEDVNLPVSSDRNNSIIENRDVKLEIKV